MKRPKSIRVRINFTLDVNPEAWVLNYGTALGSNTGIICKGPNGIMADVRGYFENVCREQLEHIGCVGIKEAPNAH